MPAELPLAMLGLSWREANTGARSALLAADQGEDAPSARLLAGGAARGVVRVETCSRVAWVLSSPEPGWAAALLRAALLDAVGGPRPGLEPRVRVGRAALDHLFRVALGLDSAVEGERAVGGQVRRGFQRAHQAGATDPVLRIVWRELDRLLAGGGGGRTRGVHSLVAERLAEIEAEIPVLGTGQIGVRVARALPRARPFARAALAAFLAEAGRAPAVVVCTGAPAPWLDLPARGDGPLAVDLGAPGQIRVASGWTLLGLDALLARGQTLPEAELARREARIEASSAAVLRALSAPRPAAALAALDQERRAFLAGELTELSRDLPPQAAKALRQRLHRLGHRMLQAVADPQGGRR